MGDKLLQSVLDDDRITFIGVDWARLGKDWTAATCGRCATHHRWRQRTPKRCRCCGLKFLFTANQSPGQSRPHPIGETLMAVSDEMVLAGAKALHEAWRSWATLSSSKDGLWEDLHKNDRASYLRDSRAVLTAALSDQGVVPNPAALFVMWAMLNGSWQGNDIDGGAAQDKATELGLIVETIFDPAVHGESDYCDPGDTWYVPSERLLAMLPASTPVRSS